MVRLSEQLRFASVFAMEWNLGSPLVRSHKNDPPVASRMKAHAKRSDQPADRLAAVDRVRPAGGVMKFAVAADAQLAQDRRSQVGWRIGLGDWRAAVLVAGANHSSRLDATAGEETGEDVAPVVPARGEDFARGVLA